MIVYEHRLYVYQLKNGKYGAYIRRYRKNGKDKESTAFVVQTIDGGTIEYDTADEAMRKVASLLVQRLSKGE